MVAKRQKQLRSRKIGPLGFIWVSLKVNLSSAMEYRSNFFFLLFGMFLNDVIWMILWLAFFARFPQVNSWGFQDMIALYAVITCAYGWAGVLFGNFTHIAKIVRDGQLDFYLALPRDELLHVLVSRGKFGAFGDLLFGIVLTVMFLPLHLWPLWALLSFLAGVVVISFAVCLGSLSFYLGSSVELTKQGMNSFIGLASYPNNVFTGWSRVLLMTIIPAAFVTGIPVELLRAWDWNSFALMIGFTILISSLAIFLFKKGIKRYESGNLINVRT